MKNILWLWGNITLPGNRWELLTGRALSCRKSASTDSVRLTHASVETWMLKDDDNYTRVPYVGSQYLMVGAREKYRRFMDTSHPPWCKGGFYWPPLLRWRKCQTFILWWSLKLGGVCLLGLALCWLLWCFRWYNWPNSQLVKPTYKWLSAPQIHILSEWLRMCQGCPLSELQVFLVVLASWVRLEQWEIKGSCSKIQNTTRYQTPNFMIMNWIPWPLSHEAPPLSRSTKHEIKRNSKLKEDRDS